MTLPEATVSEYQGVRYLHLDSVWVQGAMNLRRPHDIELVYVQRMMAWMLWRPTPQLATGHAVQLGLGAGAITRFCHRRLRMPRVTAVELNPGVIAACRQFFALPPDDAALSVVNADAGDWVADNANAGCADVLCVDLYDQDAAGPVLDDVDFYRNCRRVLADGGLMSVNLFGRDASFARSASRIAEVFGLDQVWSVQATREGNTVVIAARNVLVPPRDELERRAATLESRFGLPARKWLYMVRPLHLQEPR